jgi:uncharacterized protein YcfJ
MLRTIIALTLVAALATACATSSPGRVATYPAGGQTAEQVERDRAECTALAQQAESAAPDRIGGGAIAGAIIGIIVGVVVGAVFHVDPGPLIAQGAALGALSGAVNGAGAEIRAEDNVYLTCMAARGYAVAR